MKHLVLIPFFFCAVILTAQVDTSAWSRVKTIKFADYSITIPSIWTEDSLNSKDQLVKLDATGKGFPYFFNGAPAQAKFTISQSEEPVKATTKKIIAGYPKMPDNFFYPDTAENYKSMPPFSKKPFFEPTVEDIKLKSGLKAVLIKNRSYRKKDRLFLNYYDLVISPSKHRTIIISFSASHYDKTFSIEQIFNLDQNLRNCFESFEQVR